METSGIRKRSVSIAGHRTSVSLEDAFWDALKDIADSKKMTIGDLVDQIDCARTIGRLSSAIRVFVLQSEMARVNAEGGKPAAKTSLGLNGHGAAV